MMAASANRRLWRSFRHAFANGRVRRRLLNLLAAFVFSTVVVAVAAALLPQAATQAATAQLFNAVDRGSVEQVKLALREGA